MSEPRRTIALGPPFDDGTIPPALDGPKTDDRPSTAEGKRLLTDMGFRGNRRRRLAAYIRAIEAQAKTQGAAEERERLRERAGSRHEGWLTKLNGYPDDWRPDDLPDWADMVIDDILSYSFAEPEAT